VEKGKDSAPGGSNGGCAVYEAPATAWASSIHGLGEQGE
jgi:hypothetical protein